MGDHVLDRLLLCPAQRVHASVHHQATRAEYLLTQVPVPEEEVKEDFGVTCVLADLRKVTFLCRTEKKRRSITGTKL